jgi:hypothetical protein
MPRVFSEGKRKYLKMQDMDSGVKNTAERFKKGSLQLGVGMRRGFRGKRGCETVYVEGRANTGRR